MKNSRMLTVSQLNFFVRSMLEEDPRLRDIYIRGELSNFTDHFKTGHFYFTLKEGGSAVKAVMFASYAKNVPFSPENGMEVLVRASVSLYERDGAYQLYVYEMQPVGKGSLQLAYEQLLAKLKGEGLFDIERKRPLPQYPQTIGIITSETGAALHDIVTIISRRYPPAKLLLHPAIVQGEGAAATLIKGLQVLGTPKRCDLIIIGRGGGSMEDLWAFNNEALVRAVAACPVPVISAVGHETDTTLCDFAADLRAPTPSAAAELAVPQKEKLLEQLAHCQQVIEGGLRSTLSQRQQHFSDILQRPEFKYYDRYLDSYTKNIEYFSKTVYSFANNVIMMKSGQLQQIAGQLHQQNPWRRLQQGYSIVTGEQGKMVRSVQEVHPGEALVVQMADGTVDCIVEKVHPGRGTAFKSTESQ